MSFEFIENFNELFSTAYIKGYIYIIEILVYGSGVFVKILYLSRKILGGKSAQTNFPFNMHYIEFNGRFVFLKWAVFRYAEQKTE